MPNFACLLRDLARHSFGVCWMPLQIFFLCDVWFFFVSFFEILDAPWKIAGIVVTPRVSCTNVQFWVICTIWGRSLARWRWLVTEECCIFYTVHWVIRGMVRRRIAWKMLWSKYQFSELLGRWIFRWVHVLARSYGFGVHLRRIFWYFFSYSPRRTSLTRVYCLQYHSRVSIRLLSRRNHPKCIDIWSCRVFYWLFSYFRCHP